MTTVALIFVLIWSVGLLGVFIVLFRLLPKERWQFIAAVPGRYRGDNAYQGVNLTWYGFFTATAVVYALSLFIALSRAAGAQLGQTLLFAGVILSVAIPSSKIVAAIVEKRKGTVTVAGAAALSVGLFFDFSVPVFPDILRAEAIFLDARFLLSLQLLWGLCFVYLGVSSVTRSEIRFSSCLHELSKSSGQSAGEKADPSRHLPAA